MEALLKDKKGVVFGVANKRSIAWAISQGLASAGARLCLTYQGERIRENVEGLAQTLQNPLILPCDVTKDSEIDYVFQTIDREFGGLDFLIHAVAYAKREELAGAFLETSRDGYHLAQDVSAYSLTALAKRAAPLMAKNGGGSIVALTYIGGWRVVPRYNVMGVAKAALEASIRYLAADLGKENIRVNGISAGPISTLAARGIRGFTQMLGFVKEKSPLRRNTDVMEVADTAVFLTSQMSRGITGEIIFVDSGYHIMGM